MIGVHTGTLIAACPGWEGVQCWEVKIGDRPGVCRAISYPELQGNLCVGDTVLLNTTALDKSLGTGGWALVVAALARENHADMSQPGHIMKARYLPGQIATCSVDDPQGPHYQTLVRARSLKKCPVVIADLHSSLPAVIAGVHADDGAHPRMRPLRVAYIMTDTAAMPVAFSRTVAQLRKTGDLAAVISVGQGFGGDYEAVSVHSALLAAVHIIQAEVIVVSQGPGNVGTGTAWGFSGVNLGEVANAVEVLGGQAIVSPRISEADPRPRHQGISHHSMTVCTKVVRGEFVVPLPEVRGKFRRKLRAQGKRIVQDAWGSPELVWVGIAGLGAVLQESPVQSSTMGRDFAADESAFYTAAAAGRYAAQLWRKRKSRA